MTREEMLKKLTNIKPGTALTWLPNEYALECQYVTNEGTAYEWIGMYDWPAAMIYDVPENRLEVIKRKVMSNSLVEKDLKGTGLGLLWDSYNANPHEVANTDINTFFKNIVSVEMPADGPLYALINYRSEDEPTDFFSSYEEFQEDFSSNVGIDTRWEDMDDSDLEEWVNTLKEQFDGVTMLCFSLDEG